MNNFITALLFKQRFLIRAYKYLFKFDSDEIAYVRQNLSEGDSAMDIGAHKGAYTYWMHRSVKKSGNIICIEPQPILPDYLNKMKMIFGFQNVTVLDCAVSDVERDGEISIPGKKGGVSQCAGIHDQGHESKKEFYTVKVKIRSVDGILQEAALRPKLIKIDVEGHEFQVLKGMTKTMKDDKPLIIMECEARHIKDFTVFNVFNLLLEKDYKGYFFQGGQKKPLSSFDLDRDQTGHLKDHKRPHPDYVANFIFEPN